MPVEIGFGVLAMFGLLLLVAAIMPGAQIFGIKLSSEHRISAIAIALTLLFTGGVGAVVSSAIGDPGEASTDEPEATATVEPEATATVEPEATATVEPEATATVEPEATATVEPEATATAIPEPTARPVRRCSTGYSAVDNDGDGTPDVCVLTRAINQAIESELCPAGLEPSDTDGDGSPDVCLQVVASNLDAQPEGFCPAGFLMAATRAATASSTFAMPTQRHWMMNSDEISA